MPKMPDSVRQKISQKMSGRPKSDETRRRMVEGQKDRWARYTPEKRLQMRERITGPNHWGWKGENASYYVIHHWIKRELGPPGPCEHCGATEGQFEWASISRKCVRDLLDWMSLCISCHRKYDKGGVSA